MRDFRGKEILTGSKIVYPGRQGSSMWMNEGEVVGFYTYSSYYGGSKVGIKVRTKSGRLTHTRCTGRVAVVD